MKRSRILAPAALGLVVVSTLVVIPGDADATPSRVPLDPPVAWDAGPSLAVAPPVDRSAPAPTSAVSPAPALVPAALVPAALVDAALHDGAGLGGGSLVGFLPAEPVAPDPTDAAYAARLRAELCAARQVFCDVDDSGRYIG